MSIPEPQTAIQPPQRPWFQYSLRTLLLLTFVCAIALKAGLEWRRQYRMSIARKWTQAVLSQDYTNLPGSWRGDSWPNLPACPASLDKTAQPIILQLAMTALELPRERIAGLRILVESDSDNALAMLLDALHGERDPTVLATELRLIGLHRDVTDADTVFSYLQNSNAAVRAAAADALGLIHCPAYKIESIAYVPGGGAVFQSDPPIDLSPLIDSVISHGKRRSVRYAGELLPMNVVELPAPMRKSLETMMLEGASSDERIAAARALLAWPPTDYRLRVAEWGVWINDGGQLKLVQSVLDEIPPFVHRTGDALDSLSSRAHLINEPMVITKPIIHLTADQPLAADLEVLLVQGRPWFAYPRPDDFSMIAKMMDGIKGWSQDAGEEIAGISVTKLPTLQPTGEGYPWLAPHHREYEVDGSHESGWGYHINITDLGLHWQSVIVSPNRQSWMAPPAIDDHQRYGWWERLREVPCSWVSSQGESERFLYYDGPTQMKSPVSVQLNEMKLSLKSTHLSPIVANNIWKQDQDRVRTASSESPKRIGIYIEVTNGQATARVVPTVPMAYGGSEIDLKSLPSLSADAAQRRFLSMLTDYGLTSEEAAGLADVWKRQFWMTPGKRFLVILNPNDYDALCPMRMRPKPTEVVRLAILLTEL